MFFFSFSSATVEMKNKGRCEGQKHTQTSRALEEQETVKGSRGCGTEEEAARRQKEGHR